MKDIYIKSTFGVKNGYYVGLCSNNLESEGSLGEKKKKWVHTQRETQIGSYEVALRVKGSSLGYWLPSPISRLPKV